MATLPNGTYANSDTPLWATANAPNSNLTTNAVTLIGSPPLVLTNDGGVLKQNGFSDILTSLWSTTPATSNKVYMDTSNILSNVGSNLYFAGTLLADAGAVPNIADWSLYPQLSNINGNAFSISNSSGYSGTGTITTTSNISASGNVSGGSGTFPTLDTAQINGTGTFGNLGITSSNEIIVNAGAIETNSRSYEIDVDAGINLFDYADFNVSCSNGNRGRINLTSSGGFSNGVFGEINLVANGGTTPGSPSVATGGLITITANTPVSTVYTTTSAIKLSASSILNYAGSVSPVFSTAGYNYIFGQVGVNIVCSASPPVIPSLPLSIYMYSDQGTRISNGLRTDTITNIGSPTGTLAISGSGVGSIVTLANVRSIAGSSPATITGFSNISTTNIALSTINSSTYTPTSNWAQFPASQNVNMSNRIITNNDGISNGTSLGWGVQASSIGIYALGSNQNVVIQANNEAGNITLEPGVTGNVTAPRLVVSSNITTSNINLSKINGVTYAPSSADWSSYPATQNVNLSNFSVSNATGVSSSSSLTLAGQGIALNSSGANNLTMTTASTGNIGLTAGGGLLLTTTTGDIELTAGGGSLIDMKSGVNMFNNNITNVSNITSPNPIGITASNTLNLTSSGQMTLQTTGGSYDIVAIASGTGDVRLGGGALGVVDLEGGTRMTGGVFERLIGAGYVNQPIFQYGQINSTGNNGNQLVTLTNSYTSSGSFSVQVSMGDAQPAQMSVAVLSANSFRIYWANAGSGTHNINWLAYGV